MSEVQQFAAIADTHGNRWALETVLADICSRGISTIVNLGDDLYGPLDIHGTAALLATIPGLRVQGNCDRILLETNEVYPASTVMRNRSMLTESERLWLTSAPKAAEFEDILLCHGTPWSDDEYLLWKVTASGVVPRSENELQQYFEQIDQQVILCAHSHTPLTRQLSNGRMIVNVGSVGLAAYADELPLPHAMQTGSAHARYAVLTKSAQGWNAEHISVVYDWESAASCAEENNRHDWAAWIRSGRA
jgi:predicted phosphodiesterase